MRPRPSAPWSRLWRLDIAADRLQRLALALGADVPMCLGARPAFVGGIGEEVEAAPGLPACALVLVNPRQALPTPKVFALRTGAFSERRSIRSTARLRAGSGRSLASRRNDLTAAAVAVVPAVAEVLAALAARTGRPAGADERQRRHLLRPVRGRGCGPGSGGVAGRTPPRLVGHLGRRGCGRYRRRCGTTLRPALRAATFPRKFPSGTWGVAKR